MQKKRRNFIPEWSIKYDHHEIKKKVCHQISLIRLTCRPTFLSLCSLIKFLLKLIKETEILGKFTLSILSRLVFANIRISPILFFQIADHDFLGNITNSCQLSALKKKKIFVVLLSRSQTNIFEQEELFK